MNVLLAFITPTIVPYKGETRPDMHYTYVKLFDDRHIEFRYQILGENDPNIHDQSVVMDLESYQAILDLLKSRHGDIYPLIQTRPQPAEAKKIAHTLFHLGEDKCLLPDYVLDVYDSTYLERYVSFPEAGVKAFYDAFRELAKIFNAFFRKNNIRCVWMYHRTDLQGKEVGNKKGWLFPKLEQPDIAYSEAFQDNLHAARKEASHRNSLSCEDKKAS
jgi:hypothetical protein